MVPGAPTITALHGAVLLGLFNNEVHNIQTLLVLHRAVVTIHTHFAEQSGGRWRGGEVGVEVEGCELVDHGRCRSWFE